MRITRAQVFPYSLRLRVPHVTAAGRFDSRHGYLLRIQTDQGAIGWGDAAPLAGYTPDLPGPVHDRLQALAANARGMTMVDVLATVDVLSVKFPTVVAAVESAVAVAAADAAGQSLSTHLTPGIVPHSRVAVHALVTNPAADDVAAAGRAAAAAGYRACKLKVGGRPPPDDIDRVRALRNAVGPEVALRLDANGGWNREEALTVIDGVAALGIEYIEDPVADWDELAFLRGRVGVPLAVDQLFQAPEDVPAAGEVAAVAIVKPSVAGGPGRALKLAGAADDAGLQVVFGSLLESAVGVTTAIHVAAAWAHPEAVAGLGTARMFTTDVAAAPAVEDGQVPVPVAAGLGIPIAWPDNSETDAAQLSEGGPR
jgi:o-succinylbenzoate synthase